MADEESQNTETPEIRDPMSFRDTDTSRLKRIKPQTSLRVANVDGSNEVGSETVHLKVIKEKKKQLAGILSASQTIKLRPSGGEAAPASGPAPANETPKPGTLKIKAPAAPPETSKVTRPQRSPDEMVAGDNKRPTLKLKAPGAAEAVTQPAPAPSDPTIKVTPPTTEAPAAGGSSGRATLKLKAPGEKKLKTHSLPRPAKAEVKPAPTGDQADVETSALSKSTLKLRAPSGAGGSAAPTQQAPAASGGTLKLRAPTTSDSGSKKAGGTLKLRAPGNPTEGDGGSSGKATLKLRAPTSPGGGESGDKPGTLKLKAPESAETVRQEAPKPGKTLKLRSTPSTGEPEPQTAGAEAPALPPQPVAQQQAQPGIVYTLGAVASFAMVGFVCYVTITQYLDLFQIN